MAIGINFGRRRGVISIREFTVVFVVVAADLILESVLDIGGSLWQDG